MAKQREIRDPIHGFIQRYEIEDKIIDTRVFQRLRCIKQLAMANLVYPGAVHTRFSHSLGVMHVSGVLANKLLNDPEKIRTVRLAALLHDIGHGPFSHVSEAVLDIYYDKSKVKPKAREKIHEMLTAEIIKRDLEIGKHIGQTEREKIIGILTGTHGESIEKGIISGPLDADKQDYLLRDSYFCGVKYGVFDLDRLVSTLKLHIDQRDQFLAASQDGVYAIEQFVLAKYHMTTQVYRHKTRLLTDAMITRALEIGIEVDQIGWMKDLYSYDGTDAYIKNYLEWDDSRLLNTLLHGKDENSSSAAIFKKLKDRDLFKRILSISLRNLEPAPVRDFLSTINQERVYKKEVEEKISSYLSSKLSVSIDPMHVIISSFSIKSVREQSRNDEGSIIILTNDGTPRMFEEESTLFRSIDERENDQFLEVYAPVIYIDETDKRKKRALLQKEILDILISFTDDYLRRNKEETK